MVILCPYLQTEAQQDEITVHEAAGWQSTSRNEICQIYPTAPTVPASSQDHKNKV